MNRLTDNDFKDFNEILSKMDIRLMDAVEKEEAKEGVYIDVINLARDLSNLMGKLKTSQLGAIVARRSQPDRRVIHHLSLEQKYAKCERGLYIKCKLCEYPIANNSKSMKRHLETEKCRTRYNLKVSGSIAPKINHELHGKIQNLDCVLNRVNKEKRRQAEERENELIADSSDEES
jgi:hypothetical protein